MAELVRLTYARFGVPGVQPIIGGTSSKTLGGASGSASGSAPAIGTSTRTAAGVTGSAGGNTITSERARVTQVRFETPRPPGNALTGTSSLTLAGVTGSATSGAIERARVTSARFEIPPPDIEAPVDAPVTLAVTTLSVTLTGDIALEVAALGTSTQTIGPLTGSATGVLGGSGFGGRGSDAVMAGVSGSASGGPIASGTASDSYVGVSGSASAVTIPLLPIVGTSVNTLANTVGAAVGTATGILAITGSSVRLMTGVFTDINMASLVTLAGVSGTGLGGLRALSLSTTRTPQTSGSNELVRAK